MLARASHALQMIPEPLTLPPTSDGHVTALSARTRQSVKGENLSADAEPIAVHAETDAPAPNSAKKHLALEILNKEISLQHGIRGHVLDPDTSSPLARLRVLTVTHAQALYM